MSDLKCNYQSKVCVRDLGEALSKACCQHCGVTASELSLRGEILEVCGEEFSSDPVSGERELTTIALCPDCHRDFHKDARGRHTPCQIKARFSRECLL